MEIVLGLQSIVILALIGFIIWRSSRTDDNTAATLIKQDITNLSESVTSLKDGLNKQINDRLDKNNEQMLKQFKQSADIIRNVTQKLTELEKTNQQVGNVADELKVLQNVLANPKQRGVLGEYYLNQVLENVLPPERFKLQYKFKEGETVDAVVYLDKGKILPVDSKFSLENYNRLLEEKNPDRREAIAKQFKADLKSRIDETAKYIRPKEGTMDYAFMFIPSEAIYYDLLINKVGTTNTSARDLIEYAFRDKNVIIVSPTTFMAYLQTVLQGLRSLQIEETAKEIQVQMGKLGSHLGGYKIFMEKLGNSLGTTVNHYNNASKEFKKIDTDIYKISGTNIGVEPELLDRPQTDD